MLHGVWKLASASVMVFVAQLPPGRAARAPLSAEYRVANDSSQFDFMIGQWQLDVVPKVSGLAAAMHGVPKLTGTWKAWRAAGEAGIHDELRIVDGSGNPSSIIASRRTYDPKLHKWIANSTDRARSRTATATGEWLKNEIVLVGKVTDSQGDTYLTRSRFYDITPSGFRYQQDRSDDNGRTWDEGRLKISARRVSTQSQR